MPWTIDSLPQAIAHKEWTEAQKQTFVEMANSLSDAGIPEGEAIARAAVHADDKTNSVSQKPSFYYAKHMQPGVCGYEKETILVDVDCMKRMIGTGAGIPVFVHHQTGVSLDDMKTMADGYVTESLYNELDGWGWFKIMVIDDKARLAISNGWKVSNAYRPKAQSGGGMKNNVPFDREFTDAEFTHLAIVPNPRYEDACILTPEEFKAYQEACKNKLAELQNSKPETEKGTPMFKFLKTKSEEVTNAAEATHVRLEDGRIVTLEEMVNAVKKNSDKEAKDVKDLENEMVDVQGEKMCVGDLVKKYNAMTEKKNADDKAEAEKKAKDDEEKKNADKAEEEKKNAEEAKKKAEDDEEKKNGKTNFETLMNAKDVAAVTAPVVIETTSAMIARGLQRYG